MHLWLKSRSGTVLSFCLCKSTTWFLRKRKIDSKWVIPNNNGSKRLVSYSKRLHWQSWSFCYLLKLAISHFSRMWKFRDLPWHETRIHLTLTSFTVLPFLPLLQLLECLNGYMCDHDFTMKFLPDLHNYTGLNGLVNSFS